MTPDAPPQREFPDATAATALTALVEAGPYLPWGAGAMRVGGLTAVCNDIVLAGRRVVELGSGTSTVLLARLLRQLWPDGGYRQVAVEHDAAWADWVTGQRAREGLTEGTSVVLAPLVPHARAADGLLWYDDDDDVRRGLDEALRGLLVDLLVVDGPPADTAEKVLARYPALPVLLERLAPDATVVLDDVERPGEQEVLRRWESETALRFERRDRSAGIAVGRLPAQPRDATVHG